MPGNFLGLIKSTMSGLDPISKSKDPVGLIDLLELLQPKSVVSSNILDKTIVTTNHVKYAEYIKNVKTRKNRK